MPKLSKNALAKYFTCDYCGELIRTRQGLSGHIQFKHPSGSIPQEKHPLYMLADALKLKVGMMLAGLDQEQIKEVGQYTIFWENIKTLFEQQQITLSDADFKNYLILSISQMQANEQLYNRLEKQLKLAISTLIDIQSNNITATYKKSL